MMKDQLVPALVCPLLEEDVSPSTIKRAVARVLDIRLGQSICGEDPLRRAFAFEQARRLDA